MPPPNHQGNFVRWKPPRFRGPRSTSSSDQLKSSWTRHSSPLPQRFWLSVSKSTFSSVIEVTESKVRSSRGSNARVCRWGRRPEANASLLARQSPKRPSATISFSHRVNLRYSNASLIVTTHSYNVTFSATLQTTFGASYKGRQSISRRIICNTRYLAWCTA